MPITPILTPHGRLRLDEDAAAPPLPPELEQRLTEAFAQGAGAGLLQLGAGEVGAAMPPTFSYWRGLGSLYMGAVCSMSDLEEHREKLDVPAPAESVLKGLVRSVPPMTGAEYLTASGLRAFWAEIDAAFHARLSASKQPVQDVIQSLNPAWNLVGRVHFHLAINPKDEKTPFAFMATYTARLSAHSKPQHVPLGQALREYAGAQNKDRLLSLLLPVQRAAEKCDWLRGMVDAGEIFHPLRWRPAEAFQFLGDLPVLEAAGIIARVPAGWNARRPPRPQVSAKVGGKAPSLLGMDGLLDFELSVTLDGESLTEAEIRKLLAGSRGLALLRGRWVELDPERLGQMLERFREIERASKKGGLSFGQAMRMLSGVSLSDGEALDEQSADWAKVTAGPWLAKTLEELRSPENLANVDPGKELKATLRPYQKVGLHWLHLLARLGLGACLADDMGLGKTIQVLALLLSLRAQKAAARKTSLLVAPASLLANWASEIDRFAPGLKALIAHPSAMKSTDLKSFDPERLADVDLVITSYGTLLRLPWLESFAWRLAILDEAQAIKNAATKQTRAAKKLDALAKIALTGTPIENRLEDLWSIFDFINPGLLGSLKQFTAWTKDLAKGSANPYAPLRELARPYILRRLKTDPAVISDLPDKTELKAYCQLSRKQAALYQQGVEELARKLQKAEGMERKGAILAFLMRFKQICNHPSHWLGDDAWKEQDSGKLLRLRELGEVIAAKQEKVLVFTQFREVTSPLAAFLGSIFGRPGLILHGETAVKKRKELVQRFQEDEAIPFFVLSLKAGGSGLNLTAASHVIHFDRWWNPAVENQATDRAFRIGQTRNVLVHKFVCQGTVEQKIDELIESKKQLSGELLEGGAEVNLTEMKDEEILKLVSLDIHATALEV